ncbi:MAG TPA: nuclear transport factor 2 family protein [Acidimicrobiales bacterium]|jgi:hypothetical protein
MTPSADEVRQRTLEVAQAYLVLLGQNLDEWIELWHEDGALEFPFAPTGRPDSYHGKQDILAYMKAASGRIVTEGVENLRVHPGADPEVLVAELATRGHLSTTGARYDQRYVCVFEMRDGLLWRYREYWNPLVSIEAYGGLAAWFTALDD